MRSFSRGRPGREAFLERAVEMHRLAVAHADMVAIRDAVRRRGSCDRSGCETYGISPACPMCEAGVYWAWCGGCAASS